MWMGTHKNGPSSVILNNDNTQLLSEYINGDLPYLYKVLSINTALSIQAHPTKKYAEILHKERPNVYKDPNHKPEMALALTPFEAMCGFRPYDEILFYLNGIPEFKSVIKDETYKKFNKACKDKDAKSIEAMLKQVFTEVMTADKTDITKALTKLLERISKPDGDSIPQYKGNIDAKDDSNESNESNDINVNELVIRLNKTYPCDVGIFGVFILNCFKLNKGEGIFLEANLPHAYLSGDCLETMACSDNVVRAGLTPKLRDTKVLCNMLQYKSSKPSIMYGKKIGKYTKRYAPNVKEFALERTIMKDECNESIDIKSEYPSIILIYEGNGCINNINVKAGDCLLIPKKCTKLNISCNKNNTFEVARCYTP
mmetsp:Transcript_23619/g.28918  ORF Transcript_23619/g.28918 Transcript_23619/m.28918 type:complete len:370 (+) Transcript_23619:152-1261(+)